MWTMKFCPTSKSFEFKKELFDSSITISPPTWRPPGSSDVNSALITFLNLWLCLFRLNHLEDSEIWVKYHPMTFLQTSAHCGFSSPFELPVKKNELFSFLITSKPFVSEQLYSQGVKLWNFTEPLQKISISKAIKRKWSCNAWASSTKLDQFSTPFHHLAFKHLALRH